MNPLQQGMEKNLYTIGVFIDITKAFDSISHSVLIDKMSDLGIRGLCSEWCYMGNRKQIVKITNDYSDMIKTSSGVPQGSIG